MSLIQYIVATVTTLIVFGIGDSIYLPYAFEKYSKSIGEYLRSTPALLPAAGVYFLTGLGYVYFVVRPGIASGSLASTVINSALFGFLLFSFYALTNLATLKGWPLFTLVDILYGTSIFALIGFVSFKAVTYLT